MVTDTGTDQVSTLTPRTARIYLWIGLIVLSVVYLVTSPDHRQEAEDSYDYAAAVEFGEFADLLYPYHLLYLPLVDSFYTPAKALGIADRAHPLMVLLGAVTAAATVVLFVSLLRRWLQIPWAVAVFGGGALAFSYGFWRYSGEAEVYALASLIAVVLLWTAVTVSPSRRGIALLAAVIVLAIGTHILNAALVIALPYLLSKRGWRLQELGALTVSSAVLLGAFLAGIYWYALERGVPLASDGFVGFYLSTGGPGATSVSDLLAGIAVLGAAISAPNFVYILEPGRSLLTQLFPGMSLEDELVMGTSAPTWLGLVAVLTLVVLGVSAVILARRFRVRPFLVTAEGRFLALWLLAYLAVVVWGGNARVPEVWLMILVPLWAFVVGMLRGSAVRNAEMVLLVGALALHSLVGGFAPLQLGEDRLETTSAWLATHAGENDVLVTADSSKRARYVAYQTPAHASHIGVGPDPIGDIQLFESLVTAQAPTSEIIAALNAANRMYGYRPTPVEDGQLYITADMFDPPPWLEAQRPEAADALRSLGPRIGQHFTPIPNTDYLIRTNPTS